MGSMTIGGPRGRLRIYLGAAPGVGKSYGMLDEGRRRAGRGTDVAVALVETHGRGPVESLLSGLHRIEPLTLGDPRRSAVDVDAVLRRRPDVVLVDDLAATNPAGARHRKRWQDVVEILDGGVDVITTVNIEALESLSDVVASITGSPPADTVPDSVVRGADQIELVDMAPEALRRRVAHGNVYPPEQVDAAVSHYFRVGNLAALRELALLWLADRVEEGLERYRDDHGINALWSTRERLLVALTGGPESEVLLRRGARIASRGAGVELHAVHVAPTAGGADAEDLARLRVLTEELGGTHHTVVADDPAQAVLDLARGLDATQVVVGASRRPRWRVLLGPGVSERITAGSEDIDVLVVPHPYVRRGTDPRRSTALGRRRVLVGWLVALAGPVALSLALVPTRELSTLSLQAMSFLALTVGCALIGGLWPAVASAVLGSLLLNWHFTPPTATLAIAEPFDIAALLTFLLVAVAVASVVDVAARRSAQARLARREADTLSLLHRALLRSDHDVTALLGLLRDTFGVDAASLLRDTATGWERVGAVGEEPPARPEGAATTATVAPDLVLALSPPPLQAHDRRVLAAFATHVAVILERQALAQRADSAQVLEEGNRVRTALLAAVSHDLRTPLAGIKAAVSSLRSPDVSWQPEEQAELLASIEDSTDRLHRIVANLLDLSRLQADAVRPTIGELGLEDVVSRTVADLPHGERVTLRLAPELPPVRSDAGLLDRVVANLVENALRHSPPDRPVTVATSTVGDRVELRVVDRGPGVTDRDKEQMFVAFQRLGDSRAGDGLGLGLAVARGLSQALGGALTAEDTPGGGLTMVLDLPAAPADRRTSFSEVAQP